MVGMVALKDGYSCDLADARQAGLPSTVVTIVLVAAEVVTHRDDPELARWHGAQQLFGLLQDRPPRLLEIHEQENSVNVGCERQRINDGEKSKRVDQEKVEGQ